MARKFLTPIDLNKLELRNAAIQNLAEAPATPAVGQVYFDTGDSKIKVWTGSVWANVGSSEEEIQDFVGSFVSASTGINVIYDDESNKLGIQNVGVLAVAGTTNQVLVDNATAAVNSASVTLSLPETIHRNLQGNVTGDLTGNASTATTLQTSRSIGLYGDVSGSVVFDGSANVNINAIIQPDSVALGTDTTGDYVVSVVGTENEIEVSGTGEGAAVTIGLPNSVQITDDLTVGGNLTVSGSVAYLNTTELLVEDNVVTLNSGATGTPTLDAGIEVSRGASANVGVIWSETDDVWTLTNNGTNYHAIARKFAINVGDNSASAIAVTHNLGTRDVQVQIYTNSASYDTVEADVERTDTNTVTVKFAVAPTTNQYRVVVTG
jgi:hypothetical protein